MEEILEKSYNEYVEAVHLFTSPNTNIPIFSYEEWIEEEVQWLEDVFMCMQFNRGKL